MLYALSVRTKTLALCALAATALVAAPARAADPQLVCFDETYVQELNGNVAGETFHHGIKPAATEPASWTAPINYSKGTAYLYMEVLEKPSKRNTILTVCFDGPKEGYGCFDTKTYTDVGTYETKITMGSGDVWQYGKIAWSQRRDDYHLVIKDPALGGTQGGKPASDYVPTKLRVVLTIVPPGGTYTPPAKGNGMTSGGGTADGGADPGTVDAGGGEGGSGGSADASAGSGGSDDTGGSGGATGTGGKAGGSGGSGGTGGKAGGSGGSGGSNSGGKSGSSTAGSTGSDDTGGSGDSSEPSTGGKSGGSKKASSGGCSVGGGETGSLALLMIAAALVARRRRR